MSVESTHLPDASDVKAPAKFWSFVLPLVGFLLFSLFSIYLLRQLASVPSDDEKRATERLKILSEFKQAEADKIGSGYGWVDAPNKIVRIPISRAMEVVLPDLQHKQVGPAYPIGGSRATVPVPAVPASTTPPAPTPKPAKAK